MALDGLLLTKLFHQLSLNLLWYGASQQLASTGRVLRQCESAIRN